ncbi:MAG: DNA repair protein RecO [Planctomycetota bacterium]
MYHARVKTEATVLKVIDWSATSQVLTLLTRDFGKVSALAKGARRMTAGFNAYDGPFEPGSTGEFVLILRDTTLSTVTERWLRFSLSRAADDPCHLYCACFLLEMANALTVPNDPHREAYDLLASSLRRIERSRMPVLLSAAFAFKLFRMLGFLSDVAMCVECGRRLARRARHRWSSAHAGVLCPDCDGSAASMPVSGAAVGTISRITARPPAALSGLRASLPVLRELIGLAGTITAALTDRPMRTTRFLLEGCLSP